MIVWCTLTILWNLLLIYPIAGATERMLNSIASANWNKRLNQVYNCYGSSWLLYHFTKYGKCSVSSTWMRIAGYITHIPRPFVVYGFWSHTPSGLVTPKYIDTSASSYIYYLCWLVHGTAVCVHMSNYIISHHNHFCMQSLYGMEHLISFKHTCSSFAFQYCHHTRC